MKTKKANSPEPAREGSAYITIGGREVLLGRLPHITCPDCHCELSWHMEANQVQYDHRTIKCGTPSCKNYGKLWEVPTVCLIAK